MGKKNSRNTKARIVNAAWKLFYEQGYEDTTVEDIIFESETSKGSFYHYFDGKDALLSSLSMLFDEQYELLMERPDLPENSIDLLQYLNRSLFETIENTVSIDLLSRLFSSQLVTHGERHLLDRSRTYYKLLRRVISEGQRKGEIREDFTVGEVSRAYAMFERGLMYDWCLSGGEYSLPVYAARMMPIFLNGFRKNEKSSS
ncbi:MAG: TetR/AcrR family transcriptional regulator [Oscillospiraceae bacterium]|nr:TetR/AcrR family transcriptional regulator [Oscillospiraceae bacterium]